MAAKAVAGTARSYDVSPSVGAALWPRKQSRAIARAYVSPINSIKATTVDSTPAVTAGSGDILNNGE